MVQYDISITRSKSIPKISSRTLTWWCRESSTIFDRQDSMKPKKFLIIIRDDTQSRVERANLQFDLTRERLHYSRTAVFAIYSNLHTSSANFRVFILPAKNRHTTVSCAFSNYIFQNIKDEFDFTYFCVFVSLFGRITILKWFGTSWHLLVAQCNMNVSSHWVVLVKMNRGTTLHLLTHAKVRGCWENNETGKKIPRKIQEWIPALCYHPRWPTYFLNLTLFLVSFPDMFDGDDFWVDDLCPTKL